MRKIVEKLIEEKDSFYRKDMLEAVINDVVYRIEEKSADGDYIYRGEPKSYDKVSSTLYRVHSEHASCLDQSPEEVSLVSIEQALVEFAKLHNLNTAEEITDEEVLDEMQHWGGETNCIDFTTSYEVALFFACNGLYNEHGRILLKKRCKIKEGNLREPKKPDSRVKAQKSMFVIEPKGIVEPDHVIVIPRDIKLTILKCLLRLNPPISIFTMYNETYGFIKFKEEYKDIYFRHMGAFLSVKARACRRFV